MILQLGVATDGRLILFQLSRQLSRQHLPCQLISSYSTLGSLMELLRLSMALLRLSIPSYCDRHDRWCRCSSTVIRFYHVLPCPMSSRHKRQFNIVRLLSSFFQLSCPIREQSTSLLVVTQPMVPAVICQHCQGGSLWWCLLLLC